MVEQKTNTAVVILNWNGLSWLKQFIPVLISNTNAEDADLIVADNASDDTSLDYLREEHPEVQLIVLDQNYGFAEGYNRALEQIPHDYSILLNSDVEVTQDWVQPLIATLSTSGEVVACQPKIRDFNKKNFFEYAGAAGGYIDYLGYPFCKGRIFDVLEEDQGQYDESASIFWASGACLAIRTEIYKKVGGLDNAFFAHMEEIDLCWRLKNQSYEIRYVPNSLVYHVGGGTLSKVNAKKTYLNFRNNLILLYKNLPKGTLFKILFLRMILDGVAAVKFLAAGQFKYFTAVFKAHMHFYGMLNQFKNKRKINLQNSHQKAISEIYQKKIVFEHFLRKKSRFSDLFR